MLNEIECGLFDYKLCAYLFPEMIEEKIEGESRLLFFKIKKKRTIKKIEFTGWRKEILEKIRQELLSDGINVYLTLEYKEDDFGTNTERFSEDFKLNLNQYCFVYIAGIHVYKDFFDNPEKYKEFIKKISNCYCHLYINYDVVF